MKNILLRIALMFGGVLGAFLLLRLIFTLFPHLSLEGHALFVQFRTGGEHYTLTTYDGDTFQHQPGLVRPPAENEILEDYLRYYDEAGFRLPEKRADFYPIIALGDSFTEGGTVSWIDVTAEQLDTPVRNLGWRGFGPVEEALIMEQYGSDQHEWVLIAYFEGNDLSNARSAYTNLQNGTLNIERERHFEGAPGTSTSPPPVLDDDDNYLYPLLHFVGETPYDIAYISDYLWWLNGTEDVYRQSQNVQVAQESFQKIKNLAGDACVALVYIPTKEHIYFQYSYAEGNRRYVLENGFSLQLDSDGWLDFQDEYTPQTYETVVANLNNQRNVMREVAQALGLHFIDLTPAFQDQVMDGHLLYYPYDSHWSHEGHTLAGETGAEYIADQVDCR